MAILFEIKRPTVDVWTCVAVLGCTKENAVFELVDDQRLTAINIARSGQGRRCLRITTRSLHNYVQGTPKPQTAEEVLADMFPGGSETVLSSNIARAFNCTQEFVSYLIRDKVLESLGLVRPTASSARRITRRSLAKFIKARIQ